MVLMQVRLGTSPLQGALYQLKAPYQHVWSGQRESNPHHQLGRLR